MNDFCFVVVAFNQEEYVYECLESIKYLINTYGKSRKIQLIFSDDGSCDNTVLFATKWLELNNNIFSEYQVITHKRNVGTIGNMKEALSSVNARFFHEIACDDMYFINDIFSVFEASDLVITPTIHFYDRENVAPFFDDNYIPFIYYRNAHDLKNKIIGMLEYDQCIPSPGVFLRFNIWKDDDFIQFISKYKFIEDIPEWYYVFNQYKNEFSIKVSTVPFVLYRRNVGVSNVIGKKNTPIEEDYKQIRSDIPSKKEKYPKWINIHVYLHFIRNMIIKNKWKISRSGNDELQNWSKSLDEADKHIKKIRNIVTQYMR